MQRIKYLLIIIVILFGRTQVEAQTTNQAAPEYITIPAGPEYKKSSFYQWLWGKNNRPSWYTPVKFRVMMLDTAKGGLRVNKVGGGNQSKSLQLKDKNDKNYALRSVNKSLDILLPKEFKGTFIEKLVNDQISMSHPYAALAIPIMAGNAGILHMEPQYYYIPKQPALDTLNEVYGDAVYLLEQRGSGNWEESANLGHFKKFTDSENLLELLHETNERVVDQRSFVRARLFDMLIADWDRHFDQWKWGSSDQGNVKYYVPVPTDRDQAFVRFDGALQKALLKSQPYLKNFDYSITNVQTLGWERRNLDRYFTNELNLEDWKLIAAELQKSLPDAVIEASVKQMPSEIFAISGADIIARLKSRRDHMHEYAAEYYASLAKEPEVVGSMKNEYFEINHLGSNETEVKVSRIDDAGNRSATPYFTRVFHADETDEIRVYGVGGNDVFNVTGSGGIRIRIIGGAMRDSLVNSTSSKVHYYDDNANSVKGSAIKFHRVNDSAGHSFDYDAFRYNIKGLKVSAFYNDEDRLFAGIGYTALIHKWRRKPFASKQRFSVNYSISQQGISVNYDGLFPARIGKADLLLKGYYDAVRWTNFYGLGNETKSITDDVDYYRMRTEEWFAGAGIRRIIGGHNIQLHGFFESVRVINDDGRFLSKNNPAPSPFVFGKNEFAGARFNYSFASVNDSILPTKGIVFTSGITHTQNLSKGRSFQNFAGNLRIYIPLFAGFSIASINGAGTVTGDPEFYQYVTIGEIYKLRGYRRERFWGKTGVYNLNELRFIRTVRSYLYNGKLGLLGFLDGGRVWMPGENSNTWHNTYGGGIIIAPFDKIAAQVTYGISKEMKLVQIRVSTGL